MIAPTVPFYSIFVMNFTPRIVLFNTIRVKKTLMSYPYLEHGGLVQSGILNGAGMFKTTNEF